MSGLNPWAPGFYGLGEHSATTGSRLETIHILLSTYFYKPQYFEKFFKAIYSFLFRENGMILF